MNDVEKAIEFYKAKSYEKGGLRDKYTRLSISALEKQIPKKVTYDYGLNETRCPECKTIFGYAEEGEDDEYYAPYCYECGQCLDWEEENE